MAKLEQVINQLKDKKILVLGAGLTGLSCVRFLVAQRLTCSVNDSRENVINSAEFALQFPGCNLYQGQWHESLISSADVILLSPGIDVNASGISKHISENCLVIGDIELFCQINEKPVLAITGSNGKSTVVSLLAHLGQCLGFNAMLGGNIGTPVLDQLQSDADCFILELSSFQLETVKSLKAHGACVLNVSDDHLDRHQTIENYALIKQSIYQNAKFAIFNRQDKLTAVVTDTAQTQCSFGSDEATNGDFGIVKQGEQLLLAKGEQALIAINTLPLAGVHNAMNYLAALALGETLGWPIAAMVENLASFNGLAHRCQRIKTDDDICWINDSKATNVGATLAAINGLAPTINDNNQLILIAGGDGKGADFTPLKSALSQHVSKLITLGKDGEQIGALLANSENVISIEQAVIKAKQIANKGDVVLLSPACASLDMFKNFAERGFAFEHAVQNLQEAC